MTTAAGVILAGGRSTRMGTPKADLEWQGSTLLQRTAAVLAESVDGPVIVVTAAGQAVPELPAGVEVVADPVDGLGPMQGLATGLTALTHRADIAFVCSTDLPFLHPAYVRRVVRALAEAADDIDAVVPVVRGFRQPLAAAYRVRLAPLIAELLRQGHDRPSRLGEHCSVAELDDAALLTDPEIARRDPGLESVLNINTPADYRVARHRQPPEMGSTEPA